MGKKMDAMMNKMNPRRFVLIIKHLKVPDEILKGRVAFSKVLWRNGVTLECLNPSN